MSEAPHELTFRLAYGDCDVLGIAYFATFYPWMERTYTGWLYGHGIRAADLVPDFGVYTVGLRSSCQYHTPCQVFDELTCRVIADHVGTTSYTLGFDFVRGAGLVAHGQIIYAVRSPDGTKAPIPRRIRDVIESLPPSEFAQTD